MPNITTVADLKAAIQQLEYQQTKEWNELKEEALASYENLQPLNVLKNSLQKAAALPNLKSDLINASMGLAAGYLSKSLLVGDSTSPIKKAVGALLQFGIANVVSKNSETIKLVVENLINKMSSEKINKEENL
ncbi:MAG: hypothetical protein RI955_1778 [Bacteroidota bacterium]|jgi:hypothetical protein